MMTKEFKSNLSEYQLRQKTQLQLIDKQQDAIDKYENMVCYNNSLIFVSYLFQHPIFD